MYANGSLSAWLTVDSFDSVDECKQAAKKLFHDNDSPFSFAQRVLSQCIATDDPRIKGN